MKPQHEISFSEKYFTLVTQWPKLIVLLGILLIISAGSFIPGLVKDTRSDAFMPPNHPALIYQNKSEEIFGLKDPMVIAIVSNSPNGVFTPESLQLVHWLTEKIKKTE